MKQLAHLPLILLLLISCKVWWKPLTLEQIPFSGDQIKTEGYFYRIDTVISHPLGGYKETVLARYYVFYRNGVLAHANSSLASFDELGNFLQDKEEWALFKGNSYLWGVYQVREKQVIANVWVPSSGGKHPNYVFRMDILNDSTLIQESRVYKFRPLNPKPDSVNIFTK
jgi:hypothetical protein